MTTPNRQIRASARPVPPDEVNKTLSASSGHNNMQSGAQQQRHRRRYSPRSPLLAAALPVETHALSPGEPPRSRPAAMTAHIPEVDSCYAADLTRCCLAPPLPQSRVVKSEEKAGLDVRA